MIPVTPALAILHDVEGFFGGLSPEERAILPFCHNLWLRPDQRPPPGDWRACGYIGGRGLGKSFAIGCELNARVWDGRCHHLGLMAPTEDRADEVQIQFLIDTSPPWNRAERHRGGVRWPNGATAIVFTPEAPGRSRSENLDTSWLCELVDWDPNTRREAYNNITTATRVGCAQFFYDTTSKGKNELILLLEQMHREDPGMYPILRGTTFDNPYLSQKYIRDEVRKYGKGRRGLEELWGRVFAESPGALWNQEVIDLHRRPMAPEIEIRLVAYDPALSARRDADESGIVVGSRGRADGHCYIEKDLSGHYTPAEAAKIIVDEWEAGAAGVILERNHAGDFPAHAIESEARTRGLRVEILPRTAKAFPARRAGVIFIREVHATTSKTSRGAGPATETEHGRVHIVGELPELEFELTTHEPGERKSPNRYDAHNYLVIELAGLGHDAPGAARDRMLAGASAQQKLAAQLRASTAGRRVGM